MLDKNFLRWLGIVSLMTIMAVSFQNCGNDMAGSGTSNLSSSGGGGGAGGLSAAQFAALQEEAMDILVRRCAQCHDGTVGSEVPDVTNLEDMRLTGHVRAGRPQNSAVYLAILDGSMPEGRNFPSMVETYPNEVNTILNWIKYMR